LIIKNGRLKKGIATLRRKKGGAGRREEENAG